MICPTCNELIHCPACGGDLPDQAFAAEYERGCAAGIAAVYQAAGVSPTTQSAQPLRELSEEAVEAGASALVDSCVAKGHWSHASEESKAIYRKHARAVLTAARSAK